jgi:hypothetical protein
VWFRCAPALGGGWERGGFVKNRGRFRMSGVGSDDDFQMRMGEKGKKQIPSGDDKQEKQRRRQQRQQQKQIPFGDDKQERQQNRQCSDATVLVGVDVFGADSYSYETGKQAAESWMGGEEAEQEWWFDRGGVAEDF